MLPFALPTPAPPCGSRVEASLVMINTSDRGGGGKGHRTGGLRCTWAEGGLKHDAHRVGTGGIRMNSLGKKKRIIS